MNRDLEPARDDWQALPKIDLHRHLEGSVPISLVQRLAEEGRIPFSPDRDQLIDKFTINPSDPRTPRSFLAPFANIRQIFQNEEIIREVARSVIDQAARDNVRYLELHLTPTALAAASGLTAEQVIKTVCRSSSKAAETRSIEVNFIVSLNRHEPIGQAEASIQAAVNLASWGVVAVDLAGDESNHTAEPFAPLLRQAKAAGLALSIHAGEWDGSRSVGYAIQELGADRIVHGIRIMEDQDLVRIARQSRLPFAVCLSSNLQSGVASSLEQHPLPLMIAAGLQVSLGTDDPSVSRTTLTREFQLAAGHLDLSYDSICGMILVAAQAAFAPDKQRQALERNFQRWLGLAADPSQQ